MDKIIPWAGWVTLIATYYPSGKRGRPPLGVETMLRTYLMQNWFNLSNEGKASKMQFTTVMPCVRS